MTDLVKVGTVEAKDQVGFTRTILALSGASALFRLLLQLTTGIWAALPGAAFLVQFVPPRSLCLFSLWRDFDVDET